MHPVLEQQAAMEAGGSATYAPPDEGYAPDLVGAMSLNGKVPGVVAGIVIGSLATLIALRLAGFRFSFGVDLGGGS
jgi:hypothetical protein